MNEFKPMVICAHTPHTLSSFETLPIVLPSPLFHPLNTRCT